MKIGFLVEDITQVGGVERVVCMLANYFYRFYKYDIEIISLIPPKNNGIVFELDNNIKITYLNYDNKGNFFKKHIKGLIMYKKLFNEIDMDIDIVFSLYTKTNLYFSILKKKIKPKIIACQHGQYYADGILFRIMERIFYRKLELVVLLTKKDQEVYRKFCKKAIVIPNATPFRNYEPYDGISKKIVNIGRLSSEKSVDYLIKAFNLINKEFPDWTLEIVGDGDEKEKLVNMVKDYGMEKQVIFSGFSKEVKKKYEESAFAVLTSQTEGFSMMLVECKACGIPTISFDVETGPREVIVDREDGLLIPKNNIEELSEAMKKLITDKELRIEMSKKAIENSKKYYIENIAEIWKNVIEEYYKFNTK